jgi:hypothetical protein
LCSIARANIRLYSERVGFRPQIEIVCSDAAQYMFRPEDNVVFMFHPFGETVIGRVIENLRKSLAETPRPVWIIYTLPVFLESVERKSGFHEEGRYIYGGFEFVVLRNV